MNKLTIDLKPIGLLLIPALLIGLMYYEIGGQKEVSVDGIVIDKRHTPAHGSSGFFSTATPESYTLILNIEGYGVKAFSGLHESWFYNKRIGDKITVYRNIGNISGHLYDPSLFR